jgi:O-antigen ligase
MGVGLLISLSKLAHASGRWKVSFAAIAMVFAYGVAVSFTRSAWLSVALALGLTQFYFRGMWKWTLPTGVLCLLALAIASQTLMQNDVVQDRVLDGENVSGRVERTVWGWHRFLERPFIGRGPGALDMMMAKNFKVDGFATSHNTYLTILVDNGVFLFLCCCLIVGRWTSRAWSVVANLNRNQFERSAAAALLGCIVIWLLTATSTELRYFSYYNTLIWVSGAAIECLAGACAASRSEPVLAGASE